MRCTALFVLLPLVTLSACDASGPEPTAPGAVRVVTVSSGDDVDWNGYEVIASSGSRTVVEPNGTVLLDAPPGTASIELGDVAGNCAVAGANPATADVPAGDTVDVTFSITCAAHPRFEVREITAGDQVSCAVTMAGEGYCWGEWRAVGAGYGVPAVSCDGSACIPEPTSVSGGHEWRTIRAGPGKLVCGLTTGGSAYCWGEGSLGDGTAEVAVTPRPVHGGRSYTSIAVGPSVCAIESTGETWCWGDNSRGEVGDGTVDQRLLPVRVAGDPGFAQLAVGDRFACGRTSVGLVYCWGDNTHGQLGLGDADRSPHPDLDTVAGGGRFEDLAAGATHACGLTAAGSAHCWGQGYAEVPSATAADLTFSHVAPGTLHTCGIATDGLGYCWGYNGQGQLGTGGEETTELPPTPVAADARWQAMTGATFHTCALDTDSLAYCWGINSHRQLGTWGDRTKPTAVIAPDSV